MAARMKKPNSHTTSKRTWRTRAQQWLFIAFIPCMLTSPALSATQYSDKEFTLAKRYVFSSCIFHYYPGTALANEADAWAAALVEDGSLPAEAYTALTKLAKSAPTPTATQNGQVMRMENCFNFVERKDVTVQIKRLMRGQIK